VIASQKIGKSFAIALNYNIKKLNHPDINKRAELLETNFTSLTVQRIKQEVDLIRELRPNLNRYVYHTSLNFSNEEIGSLTNDKLLAIAQDYLQANGFTNNQYLIFRHYDASHPHLHLLVNRIGFDGNVVSDSNNFKRSEEIVRSLELKYGLIKVKSSKSAQVKAPKISEIEMSIRLGKPSEKMMLQAKLSKILNQHNLSIQNLINQGEGQGIHFLFNQASTGRISGITYFHNGFIIKGQALGNKFKWGELIKTINYEQIRDGKAVSESSSRTKAIYGNYTSNDKEFKPNEQRGNRKGNDELLTGGATDPFDHNGKSTNFDQTRAEDQPSRKGSLEASQDADILDNSTVDLEPGSFSNSHGIEINDDVDDEAINGRNRHRQRKTRTNTR